MIYTLQLLIKCINKSNKNSNMVNNGNVMMGKGKGIKENKSADEDGEKGGEVLNGKTWLF